MRKNSGDKIKPVLSAFVISELRLSFDKKIKRAIPDVKAIKVRSVRKQVVMKQVKKPVKKPVKKMKGGARSDFFE